VEAKQAKIRMMKNVIPWALVLSLAWLLIPFAVVNAQGVTVSVGAPTTVSKGTTFDVNINISNISPGNRLDSTQFDLTYDPAVIQVTGGEGDSGVTHGLIDSTSFPVDMWTFQPPGTPSRTIRVLGNLPGTSGVSGSGSLAQIHFTVLGAGGTSTALQLSNVMLYNSNAELITPVSLTNGWVTVSGLSLTITTPLAGGVINGSYSQTLAASGGLAPYKWSIISGILATGLSLTSTGTVIGMPTVAGKYNVTISVTDSSSPPQTASQVLTLSIYLKGDTNGDSQIDMGDAVRVERMISGLDTSTPGADANTDGFVTKEDVAKIERIILGLDP
jgi:hypothetical protein